MSRFVGVAGLPRAGSTLLCQLLAEHPRIYSDGHSSPLCSILLRLRHGISDDDFFLSQLDVDFDRTAGGPVPIGGPRDRRPPRRLVDRAVAHPAADGQLGAGREGRPLQVEAIARELDSRLGRAHRLWILRMRGADR